MIRINDDYVIHGNTNDYTLAIDLHRKDKDGKPIYKSIGYFGSVQAALNGLYQYMTRKAVADKHMTLLEAAK